MGLFPLNESSPYVFFNLWEKEIAWIIVSIIALICVKIFFTRSQKVKEISDVQSQLFRAMAYFGIGYALSRIFFIFSDFARWNEGESLLYVRFVLLSYVAMFFFSWALVSIVEKRILQWKKGILTIIFSIISIGVLILLIFIQISMEYLVIIRILTTALGTIAVAVFLYLFAFLIKNSTGELRKKSIFTFFGILLIFLGNFMDSELIVRNLNMPIWVPALFPILGYVLIVLYQKPIE